MTGPIFQDRQNPITIFLVRGFLMAAERYNDYRKQIKENKYLSFGDRNQLMQNYEDALGKTKPKHGDSRFFEDIPTFEGFKQVLGDVKREGKQRQAIVKEQLKLVQGNLNSGFQKSVANSFVGATGVQQSIGKTY